MRESFLEQLTFGNFIQYVLYLRHLKCIMSVWLFWGITFMVVSSTAYGANVAECRGRYFMISTDFNFTKNHSWFEVVDNGVHKLEANYAAECGYTLSTFNTEAVLRVSYFACHVENKGDEEFTLRYQIVKLDERGRRTTYPSEISCKLERDWKPREMVCEENYMEVSVRRNTTGLSKTSMAKDRAVVPSGDTRLSGLQVLIKKSNDKPITLSFEEARRQGYNMTATPHRIVFRSPYNKTLAEIKMIDDIEVEMISATVVFRQNWELVKIDMIAACAISPGSFNGTHLAWSVPRIMPPLTQSSSRFEDKAVLMGVNGQDVDKATMKKHDYRLDTFGSHVTMSVPLWAIGGVNESRVINNGYNSRYAIQFYLQHVWADDMYEETELRSFRLVVTPYILRVPFSIDQTVLENRIFTVHVGNIPYDVDLTTVKFNGVSFTVPEAIQSGYSITKISQSNGTHAYVIRVPFDDPTVHKKEEGIPWWSLTINCTLSKMPQEDPYYYSVSVMARQDDHHPPALNGVCTEKGIIFSVERKKLGSLWEVSIGDNPLTPELAAQHGYILLNDSQRLTLEVPLFTTGYVYEDINLRQFFGTFEIISRDIKTRRITDTTATRCRFKTNELIVCAPDGVVTVVMSMAMTVPAVDPSQTTLLDKFCKPKEFDESRARFTFHVNTCGTRLMVNDKYLNYENEVVFNRATIPAYQPVITRNSEFRVTVNCYYPMNDTVRLPTDGKFLKEPHVPGVGSVIEAGGFFGKEPEQKGGLDILNGIVRGSKSEDLEILNNKKESDPFPYVPVVGVAIAVLGTMTAALIKRRC